MNKHTERVRKRIVSYLTLFDGFVDRRSIEEGVKGRRSTIRKALQILTESDSVEVKGEGVKGEPHRYKLKWQRSDSEEQSLIEQTEKKQTVTMEF